MERAPLSSLRALAAVQQAGSITEAARLLGASQPAITRAIRHMEAELGFAVLQRHARGVAFTPQGKALLKHAQLVQVLENEAGQALAGWHANRPREVRVASTDLAVAELLPAALNLLQSSSPEVKVRIVEASYPDVLHYFRSGLIDLAIGPVPAADLSERFRVELLLESALVVALGSGHKLRQARSLAALAKLGWVVQRSVNAPHDSLNDIFSRAGVEPPRKVLTCESASTALQFIEGEGFAGLIPRHVALDACRSGRLQLVPVKEALPCQTLGVFYPLSNPLDAASRMLFSALRLAARRTKNSSEVMA